MSDVPMLQHFAVCCVSWITLFGLIRANGALLQRLNMKWCLMKMCLHIVHSRLSGSSFWACDSAAAGRLAELFLWNLCLLCVVEKGRGDWSMKKTVLQSRTVRFVMKQQVLHHLNGNNLDTEIISHNFVSSFVDIKHQHTCWCFIKQQMHNFKAVLKLKYL